MYIYIYTLVVIYPNVCGFGVSNSCDSVTLFSFCKGRWLFQRQMFEARLWKKRDLWVFPAQRPWGDVVGGLGLEVRKILPQGGEVIQGFSIKMLIETIFSDVVSWHVAFPCCGFYIVTSLNYWPWDMCAIYFHPDVVVLILSHMTSRAPLATWSSLRRLRGLDSLNAFWVDDLWNFKWHGNGILCFQIWQFTSFTFATL